MESNGTCACVHFSVSFFLVNIDYKYLLTVFTPQTIEEVAYKKIEWNFEKIR